MPASSGSHRPCRVVLVDDHPIVRAGLATLIDAERDLEVCGQAASVQQALELVEQQQPDLVCIDLSLGQASGLDLVKQLAGSRVEMLVVSIHKDPTWAERALAAGARGYVHKGTAAHQVVEAIRSVRSGRTWVSPPIAEQLLQRIVGPNRKERPLDPVDSLSDRELQVFVRIGQGLSTQQIAEALGLSPKTVQTHRERIKEKLRVKHSAELSTRATLWVAERP